MTVTMRTATLLVALMGGGLLSGCANTSGTAGPGSRLPVYAADVTGAAKVCEASSITPGAGQAATATMKLGNDGGWCGILTHQAGPKPYGAGLLTTRPAHGTVTIHSVGDNTRIDYVPDRGYAGADSFTVKLLPGNEMVQVSVTVIQPQA